ncbi:MAG: phage tail tube protein [Steroidobacteraceae bacterium]
MPLIGNLQAMGVAKEPTWGTPTAATTADQFPPLTTPKWEEPVDPIEDDNFRMRVSKVQGWQQGFRQGKVSFETHAYADVVGNLAMGMYGTDGWASASLHPFTVNNAGEPPSYSIQMFYGIAGTHSRSFVGMYIETLSFEGTDKGPMKVKVTYAGGKASTLVVKPTTTYTTTLPWMPWQGQLTLNSVVKTNLLTWTLNLKRKVEAIPALGYQDPQSANSTDFECDGKMTFRAEDDTEYLLYNASPGVPFPAVMVFTSGSQVLTHTMTSCRFISPVSIDSGTFLKTSATFKGIDNATDSGASSLTVAGGKSGSAY